MFEGTYNDDFMKAAARTAKLGLEIPPVLLTDGQHWSPKKIAKIEPLVKKRFPKLHVNDVVASCHRIHTGMLEPLENLLGCKAYLTIGSVSTKTGNKYFRKRVHDYKLSERKVRRWMKGGFNPLKEGINFHAWVTLDSMEIFDMTYPTTFGAATGDTRVMGGVFTCHPDNLLDGIQYHPFVIGTNLLERMGVLVWLN